MPPRIPACSSVELNEKLAFVADDPGRRREGPRLRLVGQQTANARVDLLQVAGEASGRLSFTGMRCQGPEPARKRPVGPTPRREQLNAGQ
jgi:hypothetical protein